MKESGPGKSDTVLSALSRAIRPLPYWIGYKRERYGKHPLPELAIGAELRELLQSSSPRPWQVECEVDYRTLEGAGTTPLPKNGRPSQADIAIRDADNGEYLAAIEIKRWNGRYLKVREDLDKLADLTPANAELRRFLIVVFESVRPTKVITGSGRANRQWGQRLESGKSAGVKRVFRAIGHFPADSADKQAHSTRLRKAQHWVVLIEVS